MALRVKRYSYEQTDFLKGMIEKGQKHLDELFLYFHLNDKDVVLKKLDRINSKVYRTDRDGTILLKSDGKGIEIEKIKTNTNGD